MVTGIRFLKKNRIIHIFIKERRLGPRGTTESDGEQEELWQSDYKFVKEDSGVKEGIDYHELTWKDHAIELDTIRAPRDEVVTGARFRIAGERRLRFEIRKYFSIDLTNFDFSQFNSLDQVPLHSMPKQGNYYCLHQRAYGVPTMPTINNCCQFLRLMSQYVLHSHRNVFAPKICTSNSHRPTCTRIFHKQRVSDFKTKD